MFDKILFSDNTAETEIPEAVKAFAQLVAQRQSDNYDGPYSFLTEISKGKKFIKLIRREKWKDNGQLTGGSVFAFIDPDGNIYKSASSKAPAKGIRGNVNINGGGDAIGRDGYIRYFR